MTKLSIITICYNEPNLEKTCQSIVNQTWQDFEWIVIDGGSNQETQKIWDKYKYRINKFISEPDNGRYNAMNKGIKLAKGKYLNFMNAGDSFFYDSVLENIFMGKDYNSGVLYGFEYWPDSCFILKLPEKLTKEFFIEETLRHQACFIKKELFEAFGLYDENIQISADYEKWLNFIFNNVEFQRLPFIVDTFKFNGCSSDKKCLSILSKEKYSIINKYFSEYEIDNYIQQNKIIKLSFLEKIFSVKNTKTKIYKIITIFGKQIKIKGRLVDE